MDLVLSINGTMTTFQYLLVRSLALCTALSNAGMLVINKNQQCESKMF